MYAHSIYLALVHFMFKNQLTQLTPNIKSEGFPMLPHACPVICSTRVVTAVHTALNLSDRQTGARLRQRHTVFLPLIEDAGPGSSAGDVAMDGEFVAFNGRSRGDGCHAC